MWQETSPIAETFCCRQIFVEGNVLWQETFCGRNLLWGNIFGRLYFVGKRLVNILSKIAFLAGAVGTNIRKISQYIPLYVHMFITTKRLLQDYKQNNLRTSLSLWEFLQKPLCSCCTYVDSFTSLTLEKVLWFLFLDCLSKANFFGCIL